MRALLIICFVLCSCFSYSQNRKLEKLKEKTLEIGYILYKSELASWISTDILHENFNDNLSLLGGYLSYTEGDNTLAIYYDKSDERNVIFSVIFPNIINIKNQYVIDTLKRKPNLIEERLMAARENAKEKVRDDNQGFFKYFENSSYNYVPIIYDEKVSVYILTGTTVSNVVLFGNDYKFEFDEDDNIQGFHKIHNSILAFPYKASEGEPSLMSITHSHIIKEYPIITETDLCTLLLYESYVEWNGCTVVNEKYISIWNMDERQLIILTTKAWNKIQDHQNLKN